MTTSAKCAMKKPRDAIGSMVIALLAALLVTGCFSSGRTDATFTGRSPRSDAALRAAERDLGCPLSSLHVEAETGRRYLNESAFRFVIDGCGERAGYVEICDLVGDPTPPGWTSVDGTLACRYLLVTRVRLLPVEKAPVPPAAS